MKFEMNIPDRRMLVRRLEQLTSPAPPSDEMPSSCPTVSEWFLDPRCDYPRNPSNPATRRCNERRMNIAVIPVMGNIPLDQVTGRHLEAVYSRMQEQGYAPNTIQGVSCMLAMIFNAAVRAGFLTKSPTVGHRYWATDRLVKKKTPRSDFPRSCPVCKKEYTGAPAISRRDNKTEICPECGVREALTAASLPEETIHAILQQIASGEK